MQGVELIKYISDLDSELAEKVAEARRVADQKIKDAHEESARLLAEAEAEIRIMEAEAKRWISEESERLAEDAHSRAAAEKTLLRSQGLPNLNHVVEFILSKVLP
jgi:vacuolar-type H+-ATPase subunit H